jgi:rhodanese-related sulfurtransferase
MFPAQTMYVQSHSNRTLEKQMEKTMNFDKTATVYEDLYAEDFQEKLRVTPDAILLDVRTPEEFASGRIPQSININLMDRTFVSKVAVLDKSKPYLIYCRSGARSGQACAMMAHQGFEVYNLAGGIIGWRGEIC